MPQEEQLERYIEHLIDRLCEDAYNALQDTGSLSAWSEVEFRRELAEERVKFMEGLK